MLHYFPILSILKPTHIKYSYISFLMLLQYYLIEEIFKTLRKSIEREQTCKLIPFFFKCTHFDLFLHKKKHRWTFEYRKESVCICSRFKKQDVLEKVITMLKCQLCERSEMKLHPMKNKELLFFYLIKVVPFHLYYRYT